MIGEVGVLIREKIYPVNGVRLGTLQQVSERTLNHFTSKISILSQNYPNPFNPSTQIQFTLAEASYVTIQIFNSLGHQVMELLNEQKPAGMHELVLDGSQLSSGLYYYTLRTPSYSETKKMLLVK